MIGTGAGQLQHQRLGVAIDDDAGQTVRFGVHQPHRLLGSGREHAIAHGDGIAQARAEEIGIDVLALGKVPHARDDARLRAVGGPAEKLALARAHLDGRAAFSGAVQTRRPHPRTSTDAGAAAIFPCRS